MASRRNLKKKITNIASDLFLVSLMEGVNREVVCNSVHNVIKLIIRISHTEPGNVKGFYKKLNEDLNKEIKVVADEQIYYLCRTAYHQLGFVHRQTVYGSYRSRNRFYDEKRLVLLASRPYFPLDGRDSRRP